MEIIYESIPVFKAENNELEQMLEVERNYSEIISALSKVYWQIYSVDLMADTDIEGFNGYGYENKHLCRKTAVAADAENRAKTAFLFKNYLRIIYLKFSELTITIISKYDGYYLEVGLC